MLKSATVLVLTACLWATGCAATSSSTGPSSTGPSPNPPSSNPPSSNPPSSNPPSSNPPSSNPSTAATGACETEVAAAAFDVIRSQQQAFAAADFAAARGFASQGFRSWVTLREFRAIIEDGYPFLLTDPTVKLTECRMVDEAAVLRISVDADPPIALAYRLVQEQDGWRIDGASLLAEVSA